MSEVRLQLNLPPGLQPELVDWLLGWGVDSFTSTTAHGHGIEHVMNTVAERVAGKARRVLVQVTLQDEACESLLVALRQQFAGTDILYQVVPVLCSGSMRNDV